MLLEGRSADRSGGTRGESRRRRRLWPELIRPRSEGKPTLKGGKARGEEYDAKGVRIYLFPWLGCPPDAGGFRGRRWSSSGRCGRCLLLARIGIASERPSGASWMVGRLLRRPEEDPADRGFTEAAGGRGDCPLLLRPDGGFWKIAGGLLKGSGRSNWVLGGCGWRLQAGGFSGQRVRQLFVVACRHGGGLLG